MNDKFQAWFNQVNGKAIEAEDPSNKNQCMDLMFNWCDFIGIPRETVRHYYAYQVFTQPNDMTRKYFDIVYNGPTNTPQVGDIVVFGQQVGLAGHVAIDTGKSNAKDVLTEDQNWNGLLYARPITHYNYYGVLGWLHPKQQTSPDGDDIKVNKIQAVVNGSASPHDKIIQVRQILG